MAVDDLVTVGDIARLLGVSTQRVDVLSRRDGFPSPAHVLTTGRIWHRSDIKSWAKRTGRTLNNGSPKAKPQTARTR
jgi:hypothetical protein